MEGTSQLVGPVPDRVVNMGENRKGVVMRDQSRNLGQIRPDDFVWVSMSVQVRWFGESIRVREAVQGAQDPVEPSGAKCLLVASACQCGSPPSTPLMIRRSGNRPRHS